MVNIILNGAPHEVTKNHTLMMLVTSLDVLDSGIAVAVNRQVLPRAAWSDYILQLDDCVDVVRAIGGG